MTAAEFAFESPCCAFGGETFCAELFVERFHAQLELPARLPYNAKESGESLRDGCIMAGHQLDQIFVRRPGRPSRQTGEQGLPRSCMLWAYTRTVKLIFKSDCTAQVPACQADRIGADANLKQSCAV